MGDNDITRVAQVLLAVIGVALIAELVSARAQTGKVLGSGGSALSQMICVAMSPITGSACSRSLIPDVNSTITFGT